MPAPNVVVVCLDSLRKDHVGWYGTEWIDTSAIDEFANDPATVAFTDAYPEALPTIPIRTALMTGQRTLPYRLWQPLEEEDKTIAEILRQNGYVTSLITDTYHMAKPGMNFHRGFDAFTWIRGQEADAHRTAPATVDLDPYVKPTMAGTRTEAMLEQYLRNTADRDDADEEEFFAARVFQEAIEWVDRNRDQDGFFLWVDSFDPHEPWDPPANYRGRHTDPDYDGPELIHPKYGDVDWMSDDELAYVRGLYAEEVEFVDAWVGHFLAALEDRGLYEDSLIVLLSDHGHPHGDHGSTMKTADNLYGELIEIPLFVKPPADLAAEHGFEATVDALVQTDDVAPTILDLLGLDRETQSMHGHSLVPLMAGAEDPVRDVVVTGYHESEHRCVRDGRWSYLRRPPGRTDELYDLEADPDEQTNVIDEYPAEADRLAERLGQYFTTTQVTGTIQEGYETSGTPAED